MATSNAKTETPNSPDDAITNRICSESERIQANTRNFREISNDTRLIDNADTSIVGNNNSRDVTEHELLNNGVVTKIFNDRVVAGYNNNNNNHNYVNENKVPDCRDIKGALIGCNTILNPDKKKFLTSITTQRRPSSVPASNEYQIRHEKESSRNKSASENSLYDVSYSKRGEVEQITEEPIIKKTFAKFDEENNFPAVGRNCHEKELLKMSVRVADVANDCCDNSSAIGSDEKIGVDDNSIKLSDGEVENGTISNNDAQINNNSELKGCGGIYGENNLPSQNLGVEEINEINILNNFKFQGLLKVDECSSEEINNSYVQSNKSKINEKESLENQQSDLDIINLNLKETLNKFDEKISSLPCEQSEVNLNGAKDRNLRFRKCYSDSKTCSKIYPIYENVNKVNNDNYRVVNTMESLNVKNLEKNRLNCNNRDEHKARKSYHQDVEEALSSLLWQPYEYQNVYKNSDIRSSSSVSSSSSGCSSSSSSCSTISSRGSFRRRDLERSNNGPVHRQQSTKSGNSASDLHLRTEMVNNPATHGNENLLSQWGEAQRSRDAAALSNASRLMVGVSTEVRCLRAVASLDRTAYVFCDCDACLSDMRLEVCEDVTPLTSTTALAHETTVAQSVAEANRSNSNNNVTLNQQQHLSIGATTQVNMQQQQQQRSVIENNYQRNSLSSVNVVGLPRPNANRPGVGNNGLFANHPRNASEPISMTQQSNQFKYTSNVVPNYHHQRHNSQIESGNVHTINHMRSASVPKTVPHATQKVGESRSGSDLKVIVGSEQQQTQQTRQQRLPLNVSNVNVNYYRAVPVNVVSSVPTIQCVNSGESNVSNVNIVQAMPVVNTPNTCTYTTCNSSANYVQNYSQQFAFANPQQFGSTPNNNNNQIQQIHHAPPLQQCAITTFGSSIITQHFPSGSTYNLSTPQVVPNNVQINTANQNIQQSTQTHISYSNDNNVMQSGGTIVVPSIGTQTNPHTFSTTEVTVHSPPSSSQIQIVPPQVSRPPPPPNNLQEVRTRTFTSTEAQTDETAVNTTTTTSNNNNNSNAQSDSGNNREQRRRERRERRHHRRVNSANHRHGTTEHGTQWNSLQNERLPDILNSHMPPSYASAVNNVPPQQPVLPNAIVSNPLVPPGTVVQTMVPNNIVPSGLVGNPIVPFPPPVVPGQVPLVQGAAPVPVPVPAPSGFRFPFPAAGFRR